MEGVRARVRKSRPWEGFGHAVTAEPSRVLAAPSAFLGRVVLAQGMPRPRHGSPSDGSQTPGACTSGGLFRTCGSGLGRPRSCPTCHLRAGSGRKDTTPLRWVGLGAEAKGHSGPEGSVRSRHMSLLLKVRRSEQVT